MDVTKFNGILRARGLSRGRLARELGISSGRFGDKLTGRRGLEFSLGQLLVLRALLRLSGEELEAIFFREELS